MLTVCTMMVDWRKMLWFTILLTLPNHGGSSLVVDSRMEGSGTPSMLHHALANSEGLRMETTAKMQQEKLQRKDRLVESLEHADRWLTQELEDGGAAVNVTEENLDENLFFQTMYSLFDDTKGYLLGEGEDYFIDSRERQENENQGVPPAYPILDALVASISLEAARISLEDLLLAMRCFLEKQTKFENLSWEVFLDKYVYKPLKEIVANILDRMAETFDRGYNYNARVVETVDEEIFISENYVARIRGATIAAYVMDSAIEQHEDGTIGKMAMAAEVLMTPNDKFASFYGANSQNLEQDYNITILLETNVMTMSNMGAMHWPGHKTKGPDRPPGPRYCFDDFHEGADFKGVLRKGRPDDGTPLLGFEFYKRSLILPIAGSTYEISSVRTLPALNLLKSRQDEDYGSILNFQNTSNIDAPTSPSSELRPLDRAIKRQWILESTRTPRPGLIAIRELYQQEYGGILNLDPIRNCFDEQSLFGFFANYDLCYAIMYNITEQAGILSDLGLSEFVDPSLLQASLGELNFMEDDIDAWYSYWIKVDPLVLQFSEVPYTFSQAIALPTKIRGSLFEIAYMANPYFTTEEIFERFTTPSNLFVPALSVCPPDAGDENLIYSFFPAALKLRLLDVPSSSEWRDMIEAEPSLLTKSTPLSEWGLYDHPNETFWGSLEIYNGDFLNQSVTFEMESEETDSEGNMQYQMIKPGNLTENKAGRNHEYFVVSPFPSDEDVQTVFREQQENLDIWARTAAKAIEADNPCRNAVDDNDLYLYVIGIIAATCGGMQTVLLTIHQSLHFFTGRFWARGRSRSSFFLWRLVPTYELIISMLGVFILLILYYPILLQLRSEQEVADFQIGAIDMDVQYSSDFTVKLAHFGQFALVTIVHVTSECQDSRVTLLRGILICGIIFGLVMNAMFLWSVFGALKRYLRIVAGSQQESEEGALRSITPADSSLRLLELPFGSKMTRAGSTERDASDGGQSGEMEPLTEAVEENNPDEQNDYVLEEGMAGIDGATENDNETGKISSKTLGTDTTVEGNDSESPIVDT